MFRCYHKDIGTTCERKIAVILYQLAKRMEQRKQLRRSIEHSEGDVRTLVTQKEQVEGQLMAQAAAWTEDGQDEFVLASLPQESAPASNQYTL